MQKEKERDFFLKCKDHTVSGEFFTLFYDKEYEMLVTSPMPSEENLGKYYKSEDYISHTDAQRSLFEKMYHFVKRYALRKKVRLISKLDLDGKQVLDIGAGTGDFLVEAKKKKWEVYGTEPNEQARILATKKGIQLQPTSKEVPAHSFDVITMWHVLEHVSNLEEQLQELKRLIKPNGYLIIAVPNFQSYDAKYYKSYWAAYDVPRHLWHFSQASIQKLFYINGMKLEQTIPMMFDSFYVSMLSEKYKTGRINYFRAFCIGFISNLRGISSKQYSSHIYVIKNV